ncbi:type III secretion system effector protein [Cedecea sp. P7760]|jgi:secreted effector protein SseD|uniref:type III secretion system effector protein n=1 Tax=Cedecea sp. P7760 TaxID=2726983 RepID=UPI00210743BA|nr:type III secretion system effector protein [Cedecea sp. P7760]
MARAVISENSMVFLDVSPTIEETGNPANRTLSVNDSVNVQGSGKGTLDTNDFFAMFDEIWSKLLMLAKQLRDTMQFYNQKKQELSWGLEINTLQQSVKAIDDSYGAAKAGAIGGMFAGVLTVGGAFFGEAGMTVGNAMGQVANGIGSWASGSETRKADAEKAIAELQNKGAQSYAKTLDDTLMKAREIMQQMMEMGRNLVEVFSQVLRAISR